MPLADADDIVIEALLDDILDVGIVRDSVAAALRLLQVGEPARQEAICCELTQVQAERVRFVRAIAVGGELEDLVTALREREQHGMRLERELAALRARLPISTADVGRNASSQHS